LHNFQQVRLVSTEPTLQQTSCITSWKKLHDQVQIQCVLKAVVHLHDPLMISLYQHVSLGTHVSNLKVGLLAFNGILSTNRLYHAVADSTSISSLAVGDTTNYNTNNITHSSTWTCGDDLPNSLKFEHTTTQ